MAPNWLVVKKRYLFLVLLSFSICSIIYVAIDWNHLVMSGIDIQIDDSYKNYPQLEGDVIEAEKEFSLNLGDDIILNGLIEFEHNKENIRIKDIIVTDVDKGFGKKASISINTTGSFHEGNEAVRLTFNLSSSGAFGNEVGSCILKLTVDETLILYSKTDNVSINP